MVARWFYCHEIVRDKRSQVLLTCPDKYYNNTAISIQYWDRGVGPRFLFNNALWWCIMLTMTVVNGEIEILLDNISFDKLDDVDKHIFENKR